MQASNKKKLLIALGLLGLSFLTTLISDYGIKRYFPTRPILDDAMFFIIPRIDVLQFFVDGVITLGFLLALAVFSERRIERVSTFVFAIGAMYFIRAILNLVTPLGDPSGEVLPYGFLERVPLAGMFPSGHIAALTVEYLLVRQWQTGKRAEFLYLLLIFLATMALWSTRGHYTIDIVGGMVLGYFAVKLANKYA